MRFFVVLFFVIASFPLCAQQAQVIESELPARIQAALDYADIPLSAVSLMVQPLDGGLPVVNLNPDVSRNPASTIKVITTYSALEVLGPAYRWPTEFYLRGELKEGVLHGDLAVKGYGDPYMVIEDFWRLLRSLRYRGIDRITGDLILDSSYFAPIDEDMGAFDSQPARTYNLSPNALMVNFQTVSFRFNDRGADVLVQMDPDLPNLRVENRLHSVAGNCRGYNAGIAIQVGNLPLRDLVQLDGKHPAGCENYRLTRTVLNADSYFYGLFKQLWQQLGGAVDGGYRSEPLILAEDEEPFMLWRSSAFREVLTSTNKFSNNTMTRHLLLTMAAEHVAIPAVTADGIGVIEDFLEARGMNIDQLEIQNGSGLSRDVRVDPQLMMDVLIDAYRSPNAAEFIASLPLNGIDGTMRSRLNGEVSEGMAHVKTGRLDDVVALAGIVQSDEGRRYALVFMVNHKDVHRGTGVDIGDLLIDWLHGFKLSD